MGETDITLDKRDGNNLFSEAKEMLRALDLDIHDVELLYISVGDPRDGESANTLNQNQIANGMSVKDFAERQVQQNQSEDSQVSDDSDEEDKTVLGCNTCGQTFTDAGEYGSHIKDCDSDSVDVGTVVDENGEGIVQPEEEDGEAPVQSEEEDGEAPVQHQGEEETVEPEKEISEADDSSVVELPDGEKIDLSAEKPDEPIEVYECKICEDDYFTTDRDRIYGHMSKHQGAVQCEICGEHWMPQSKNNHSVRAHPEKYQALNNGEEVEGESYPTRTIEPKWDTFERPERYELEDSLEESNLITEEKVQQDSKQAVLRVVSDADRPLTRVDINEELKNRGYSKTSQATKLYRNHYLNKAYSDRPNGDYEYTLAARGRNALEEMSPVSNDDSQSDEDDGEEDGLFGLL